MYSVSDEYFAQMPCWRKMTTGFGESDMLQKADFVSKSQCMKIIVLISLNYESIILNLMTLNMLMNENEVACFCFPREA